MLFSFGDLMANTINSYCEILGIQEPPSLEVARKNKDANYYSLLIVVLLERGEPVTLVEAAQRFEEAGVCPRASALASLKRCKPGRPPIYRNGDMYALDPHDDEADLWAFRLGLRSPRVGSSSLMREDAPPLPPVDTPLAVELLDEAWNRGIPSSWSAQRVALCVLDVHQTSMSPDDVVAFARERGPSMLKVASAKYWRRGAAVQVGEGGQWALNPDHDALRAARQAVLDQVESNRRMAVYRPDPAVMQANQERYEAKGAESAKKLADMQRVLLYAYPAAKPKALVLLDIRKRMLHTFVGDDIKIAARTLSDFEMIIATDVRRLLQTLGFDPGNRRLGDLSSPQKSMAINKRGRTLKLTTKLLIQSSCGIGQPFGDTKKMQKYLREGDSTRFRRRLEADAKSLLALYQYGITQGTLRVRWGFIDEHISAPWCHIDEPTLGTLKRDAHKRGVELVVVVGNAPGWKEPWARKRRASVRMPEQGYYPYLVDEDGIVIDESEVQLARLVGDAEAQEEAPPPLALRAKRMPDQKSREAVDSSPGLKPSEPLALAPIGAHAEDEAVHRAQELVYEAWQAPSSKAAIAIAKQALMISGDCADAYAILADESEDIADAMALYEEGVLAGERALGPKVFEDDVGYFWGLLETRPYMRARAGLASCLVHAGRTSEAIAHYEELLRLNPADHQGIRYELADCLDDLASHRVGPGATPRTRKSAAASSQSPSSDAALKTQAKRTRTKTKIARTAAESDVHKWAFKPRFRRNAFGWKSGPAIKRVKEAVAEIKKVARTKPIVAAEGAVLFLQKISPALESVDSSSGAIGSAVNKAITTLLPIITEAPVTQAIHKARLERLWVAYEADDIPYIELLGDHWGDLCASKEVASMWADKLIDTCKLAWSPDPDLRGFYEGTTACLSALLKAERCQELLDLLDLSPHKMWRYRKYGVRALATMGNKLDAIRYAEDSRGLNDSPIAIARACEEILLDSGFSDEAYQRYGIEANQATTYLAWFRALLKKYPNKNPSHILADLAESTPGEEGKWFAAAKSAKLFDEAIALAKSSPCSPQTLTRAARDSELGNPVFAREAGMAALYWLTQGYGYEVTGVDVLDAYTHTMAAAANAGCAEETHEKIRQLVGQEKSGQRLVTMVLGKKLGLS